VQICNVFGDAVYLPLAAGMLQAHAASQPDLAEHFQFSPICHMRFDPTETAARFFGTEVLALSTYVWNWEFSLAVARELKRLDPQVLVVIGGTQAPVDATALIGSGVVDVVVHGEGELTFAELLRAHRDGRPLASVPGVSAWQDERVQKAPPRPRLEDLSVLPSPFLRGDFEPLLAGSHRLIGLWETNRGCPFSCSFCYWGSAVNTPVRSFPDERVYAELRWFSDHQIDYVFCADANFGIKARDAQIARSVAEAKRRTGFPRKFRTFALKNTTRKVLDIAELLRDAELDMGASLAMQSLSPVTLEAIGRKNIKLQTYEALGREARTRGIVTYTDLIIGLPGETYDSFMDGIDALLSMGQHDNLHIFNCTLLEGSEMAEPAYRQEHGIVTVRSPIFERHMRASAMDRGGIQEYEDLVVGTRAMPTPDWVETNLTTTIVNALHFQKIVQLVAIWLHHRHGVRYRRLYEQIKQASRGNPRFPMLAECWALAEGYWRSVASGAGRRLAFDEYGDVVWPVEEAVHLVLSRDFGAAFRELFAAVAGLCDADGIAVDGSELADVFAYQEAQTPRPSGPARPEVELGWDFPAWFQALERGREQTLDRRPLTLQVVDHHRVGGDPARFAREVVWYGRSATTIPYRLVRVGGAPAQGSVG
jgi:radical SAM superfamily enzyme YgiQ (UPF0313 family)